MQSLLQLQVIIKSPSVQGLDIVLLIVALLETAAVVLAFLLAEGIVKFEPKPANPYGGQHGQPGGWNPQSGAFPQQGQHPQHRPARRTPRSRLRSSVGRQQPQQFGQQPQQPAAAGSLRSRRSRPASCRSPASSARRARRPVASADRSSSHASDVRRGGAGVSGATPVV